MQLVPRYANGQKCIKLKAVSAELLQAHALRRQNAAYQNQAMGNTQLRQPAQSRAMNAPSYGYQQNNAGMSR